MLALPAAPAPAPRRQLLVGTSLACAAAATFYGGMLALYLRFRESVIGTPGGVWRPKGVKIPEVPTNTMLIAFLGVFVFAQWAVYAARRDHKTYAALAIGLTALLGLAVINAQAFVYTQMEVGFHDGTYAMFFYALTGTFILLTIVGIAFSIVTAFRFLGGRTNDREIVTAHAIYWYFLGTAFAALWLVVYVTK
jgi:heme/copper-type cytochrome/quinol oxidase subunit 3